MTLKEQLIVDEGKRYRVYQCTEHKNTIGIGHNIDAKGLPDDIRSYLEQYGRINDAMIDILYETDVKDAIDDCLRLWKDFDSYSDTRKKALINAMFNMGLFKVRTKFPSFCKAVNSQDWQRAADELKYSNGLSKNRLSDYYIQTGDRAKRVIQMLLEG
jgi:GH24 family phage-related lysozyme (muramidase)